jgi:hypothetical protein
VRELQGLKPPVFELAIVAAKAATHEDQFRDELQRIVDRILLAFSVLSLHFFGRGKSSLNLLVQAYSIEFPHNCAPAAKFFFGGDVLLKKRDDFGGNRAMPFVGASAEGFVKIVGYVFDIESSHDHSIVFGTRNTKRFG